MEFKFGIDEIANIIPHAYPFLLVDRILICEPNVKATAIKNVTFNEPFFPGHFPGRAIMPGVLILEAMAQVSGICSMSAMNEEEKKNSVIFFMGIDNAKFRKPVTPGDVLHIETNVINCRGLISKYSCVAFVEDKKVCEAELTAMLKVAVSV